jgi:hypothetical protein
MEMTILQTSVSCLSDPKLRHFHTDPLQLITPHTHDIHYRRFEILLPSPTLISEKINLDIQNNRVHQSGHPKTQSTAIRVSQNPAIQPLSGGIVNIKLD